MCIRDSYAPERVVRHATRALPVHIAVEGQRCLARGLPGPVLAALRAHQGVRVTEAPGARPGDGCAAELSRR
eukprot:1036405-Alexandrium_andersonii.AAC.1